MTVSLSRRYGAIGLVLLGIVVAACLWWLRGSSSSPDGAGLPYADEYPALGYATSRPEGRAGQLAARVDSGDLTLERAPGSGYTEAVLAALEIDSASQTLVFSTTSLQVRHVHPDTPRAIYFNDDSYVAFVPGAPNLEIASFDPELGPVFYTLPQAAESRPALERELGACLRCHDTYGLTGGGVPRFLLGSGYTGENGELVSHEAWILTSQATPLRSRWGGWYVTGMHGEQVHLGNMIFASVEEVQALDSHRVGNIRDLDGLLDTSQYLTPYSDIVALLVLEHQVEVHNRISRLRFETAGGDVDEARLAELVESLVRAMLMADEAEFSARISGTSGFDGYFEGLGPFDSEGRSLRDLDLESRLFRYPLSYLIYSEAFEALPDFVRDAVYARLQRIFGDASLAAELRLDEERLDAITAILAETKPEVLATP